MLKQKVSWKVVDIWAIKTLAFIATHSWNGQYRCNSDWNIEQLDKNWSSDFYHIWSFIAAEMHLMLDPFFNFFFIKLNYLRL